MNISYSPSFRRSNQSSLSRDDKKLVMSMLESKIFERKPKNPYAQISTSRQSAHTKSNLNVKFSLKPQWRMKKKRAKRRENDKFYDRCMKV
mmetsp:Transcript_24680/g.21912  ORF Transcript_24680/g.21912 Transcript_24680/m.21912 type:complete len:91 (+) Transcript_24680:771-1043(+)